MILLAVAGMTLFLYRFDPHAGHASLMTMASIGLPNIGLFLTNSSTESPSQHYLCRTTATTTDSRFS